MTNPSFQKHLSAMMAWHFSEQTGSDFWLQYRSKLDFDPILDVKTFSDLSLFPDVSSELRNVSIDSLMPRGVSQLDIAGVFESGGTTGSAKRVITYEKWLDDVVAWRVKDFSKMISRNAEKHTLAIIPSGPHIVAAINKKRARALGGECFTVDLDPRWVKKLIQKKQMGAVRAYSDHLLDQAEPILATQHIAFLVATPPLLEAIAQRPILAQYLNKKLEMITWGGTQMNVDTLHYLKTVVFPDVLITGSYGSTMILSETKARLDEDYDGAPIFDSFRPYVLLDVIDPTRKAPVKYYERGQVVMNHLSPYALFPNIIERDTAVKIPVEDGMPGVSVSDIKPIDVVLGKQVIEGVY